MSAESILQFKDYFIDFCYFDITPKFKFNGPSDDAELNLGIAYDIEPKKQSGFLTEIDVVLEEGESKIHVNIKGIFDYDVENNDDVEKKATINGAAILFPYVRAFISSMAAQSGVDVPVIIPTVNFVELYYKNRDEE